MKILLLSNQGMVEPFVGNPIMLRYRDALLEDDRITEVQMLRCNRPFSVFLKLRKVAKKVDLIHVHFGGIYALITWILLIGIKKPIFITFHGTDIHAKAIKTSKRKAEKIRIKLNQWASFVCIIVYDKCGFVAKEMQEFVPAILCNILKNKFFIQSLGVDYKLFSLMDKENAQAQLLLPPANYILFSDIHNSTIKRRDIALLIMNKLPEYELLIMCGVNPLNVPKYINACDAILLTSDEEGSPNIIREALSLNKPVFSVDVGDAKKQLEGLDNSCIVSRDPEKAANMIRVKLFDKYIDNTRTTRKQNLDFNMCSKNAIEEYSNKLNASRIKRKN